MKTPTCIKMKSEGGSKNTTTKHKTRNKTKHTTQKKNKTNIQICTMKSKKENIIKQKQPKPKTNTTKDKGGQMIQQQISSQTTDKTKMKVNTKPKQK